MKPIIYTAAACVFPLLFSGCSIDNYERPGLRLTGTIVDSGNREPVESGGINAGTVVKIYEGQSTQPMLLSTFPAGTFVNNKLFPGKYRIVAEGPFTLTATENILDLRGNEHLDIPVVPNLRVKAALVTSGQGKIQVKVTYEKLNAQQQTAVLGVTWSTYPHPNMLVFPQGNTILEDVSGQQLPDTGERIYELTGLKPGTTYYVRGAARTLNPGNYYNYSPQLILNTNETSF